MKIRIILTFVLFVITPTFGHNNTIKKVAILETVDKEGKIPYGIKLMIRSNLANAVTATKGYEGYDRVDIASIMSEQEFQRTGMVSDANIKKLGEMTGADYVLVAEAAMIDSNIIFLAAKIIDVETARMEKTAVNQTNINPQDMQNACESLAKNLFGLGIIEKIVSKNSNTLTSFFSKEDLIKAGFKFFKPSKDLNPLQGIKGQAYLENFGPDLHRYDNSRYLYGEYVSGKLNGIIFFYDGHEDKYILSYAVDGCIAYPALTAYNDNGDFCIGIEEGSCSYLRMHGNWKEPSERPMFFELMKVYGDFIDSYAFRKAMSNGKIANYMYNLNHRFSKFINSGGLISESAWECPDNW